MNARVLSESHPPRPPPYRLGSLRPDERPDLHNWWGLRPDAVEGETCHDAATSKAGPSHVLTHVITHVLTHVITHVITLDLRRLS